MAAKKRCLWRKFSCIRNLNVHATLMFKCFDSRFSIYKYMCSFYLCIFFLYWSIYPAITDMHLQVHNVLYWQNSQNGPQTFYRRPSSSSNFQKGQYGPWTHVFGPNVSLCWCGAAKCHEMNVKCPFCPWYFELLVLLIFPCAFLTCFMFLFVCLQYSLRIQSMQPASCAFGWASTCLIFFTSSSWSWKNTEPRAT